MVIGYTELFKGVCNIGHWWKSGKKVFPKDGEICYLCKIINFNVQVKSLCFSLTVQGIRFENVEVKGHQGVYSLRGEGDV